MVHSASSVSSQSCSTAARVYGPYGSVFQTSARGTVAKSVTKPAGTANVSPLVPVQTSGAVSAQVVAVAETRRIWSLKAVGRIVIRARPLDVGATATS